MADSVLFDGVDDARTYSAGNLAGSGALSLAAIVKPVGAFTTFEFVINWNSSIAACFFIDNGVLGMYDGTNVRTGPTLVADEWWFIGGSKATGTVTPRYHTYRYSTTTWAHGNFSGTNLNWPACTSVQWCYSSGEAFGGDLLIGGGWDSELSDGTFETLEGDKASWIAAAPDEAWRFDTTGAITPFVGTSTQTGSVGATLDTGDVPAGWSDTAGDPPASFDLIGLGQKNNPSVRGPGHVSDALAAKRFE